MILYVRISMPVLMSVFPKTAKLKILSFAMNVEDNIFEGVRLSPTKN